jgi:hypothetical protein
LSTLNALLRPGGRGNASSWLLMPHLCAPLGFKLSCTYGTGSPSEQRLCNMGSSLVPAYLCAPLRTLKELCCNVALSSSALCCAVPWFAVWHQSLERPKWDNARFVINPEISMRLSLPCLHGLPIPKELVAEACASVWLVSLPPLARSTAVLLHEGWL